MISMPPVLDASDAPDPIHCLAVARAPPPAAAADTRVTYFPVTPSAHPHDVAPAPTAAVYYTAQMKGYLGRLDPGTGKDENIPIGAGSAPHGVIVGPDGAAWITDGGLNANARFDPKTRKFDYFPLPPQVPVGESQHRGVRQGRRLLVHRPERRARLRQSEDRQARELEVAAPRQLRHHGDVEQRRLVRRAGRRSSRQDRQDDRQRQHRRAAQEGRRPAPRLVGFQGRAVGQLLALRRGRPLRPGGEDLEDVAASGQSRQRLLCGPRRRAGQGLAHRFPDQCHRPLRSGNGKFESFPSDQRGAQVRQMLGRSGEVWGAESGNDRLVRIKR